MKLPDICTQSMQKFEGDVRTMPAPNFIPLEVIKFFFNGFKTENWFDYY